MPERVRVAQVGPAGGAYRCTASHTPGTSLSSRPVVRHTTFVVTDRTDTVRADDQIRVGKRSILERQPRPTFGQLLQGDQPLVQLDHVGREGVYQCLLQDCPPRSDLVVFVRPKVRRVSILQLPRRTVTAISGGFLVLPRPSFLTDARGPPFCGHAPADPHRAAPTPSTS